MLELEGQIKMEECRTIKRHSLAERKLLESTMRSHRSPKLDDFERRGELKSGQLCGNEL